MIEIINIPKMEAKSPKEPFDQWEFILKKCL